jgi:hypothetical protein
MRYLKPYTAGMQPRVRLIQQCTRRHPSPQTDAQTYHPSSSNSSSKPNPSSPTTSSISRRLSLFSSLLSLLSRLLSLFSSLASSPSSESLSTSPISSPGLSGISKILQLVGTDDDQSEYAAASCETMRTRCTRLVLRWRDKGEGSNDTSHQCCIGKIDRYITLGCNFPALFYFVPRTTHSGSICCNLKNPNIPSPCNILPFSSVTLFPSPSLAHKSTISTSLHPAKCK